MKISKTDSPQYALDRFDPSRVTFARELRGLTKKELAEKINKTPSAVSQIERGRIRPDLETFVSMSFMLQVPPSFFTKKDGFSTRIDMAACHFRALRSTSQAMRRQSARKGDLLLDFLELLESKGVLFPEENISNFNSSSETDLDIENTADGLRKHWGMGTGPIHNLTKLVESHGIFVLTLAKAFSKVDAYSTWRTKRPCIMLSTNKPVSRIRFDIGHELGHLVMHEESAVGEKKTEKQANRFAGAFLAPRESFLEECPRRWSLTAFQQLKFRWRMSIQALLYRAKDLGCISQSTHQRAMVHISKRNMRKNEGSEWEMELPVLVTQALELLSDQITLNSLADDLSVLPIELREMLSTSVPQETLNKIDRKDETDTVNIVQLRTN
jgi:Zn-dependent peptidase ImmA (M78 family)/transcriptional regulator with XRE-family HTH domain